MTAAEPFYLWRRPHKSYGIHQISETTENIRFCRMCRATARSGRKDALRALSCCSGNAVARTDLMA